MKKPLSRAKELTMIVKALQAERTYTLQVISRLQALEEMITENMTQNQKRAWRARYIAISNQKLQKLLEIVENDSPSLAAQLDHRTDDDLKDL